MLSIELLKDVQDYIIARYAEVGEELERDNAIGYWNEHTADNDLPIPSFLRVSASNAEISPLIGGAIPEEKNSIMLKAVSKPELDPLKQILANADAGFGQILLEYIDASGMTDAEVYRKAQISRSPFCGQGEPFCGCV